MAQKAYEHFANGAFSDGLRCLEANNKWAPGQDWTPESSDPLWLGFPEFPGNDGLGEGVLVASLALRLASTHGKLRVTASDAIAKLLSNEVLFEVAGCEDYPTLGKPPLWLLCQALDNDLLRSAFKCLVPPMRRPAVRRPVVGFAFASVTKGKPITEKSVVFGDFMSLFKDIDASLISFQRCPVAAGEPTNASHVRCPNPSDLVSVAEWAAGLDLMVTISTTSAHVAAALGVPTILLAAQRTDGPQWFWQAQARHDRTIYPSVRVVLGQGSGPCWWERALDTARAHVEQLIAPEPCRPRGQT